VHLQHHHMLCSCNSYFFDLTGYLIHQGVDYSQIT